MLRHIIVNDQKYNGAIRLPEAQIEIQKMEISNQSKKFFKKEGIKFLRNIKNIGNLKRQFQELIYPK